MELNRPRPAAAEYYGRPVASRYETGDARIDKNRTEVEYLLAERGALGRGHADDRAVAAGWPYSTAGRCLNAAYTMPPAEEQMPLEVLLADWGGVCPLNSRRSACRSRGALRRPPQQAKALPKVELGYKYESVRESISTASRRD